MFGLLKRTLAQKDAEIAALKAEQHRELTALRADLEVRLERLERRGHAGLALRGDRTAMR